MRSSTSTYMYTHVGICGGGIKMNRDRWAQWIKSVNMIGLNFCVYYSNSNKM